jgi:hypothetical protein
MATTTDLLYNSLVVLALEGLQALVAGATPVELRLTEEVRGADHLPFPVAEPLPPRMGGRLVEVPASHGVVGEDDAAVGKLGEAAVVAEVGESDSVVPSYLSGFFPVVSIGRDIDGQVFSIRKDGDCEEASSVDPVLYTPAGITHVTYPLGVET